MTDSERVAAARSFLDDHPGAESALTELLELDRTSESWSFEDTEFDSGRFGELVSRGIAESAGDGYQLADRAAVVTALNDEDEDAVTDPSESLTDETEAEDTSLELLPSVSIDSTVVAALGAALAVVALARSIGLSSILRDGLVVSPGNDPYYFRYIQSELLAQSDGATDLGMLVTVGEQTGTRPLAHTLNWWLAELVGPDTVAAWAPMFAAVVLGAVVYLIAVELTADRRIGIAAVLLFGLTPIHATLTQLGFLDHNPYQHLWLGVLTLALVWLADDLRDRLEADRPGVAHARNPRSWAVAGLLAGAVAATAHAWGGSPLTFVPVAAYLAVRALADVRRGVSALPANAPALGGLAAGAGLATLAHVRWGWHESIAVTTPTLVAAGGLAVMAAGSLWHRLDRSAAGLAGVELVVGLVGAVGFRRLRPDDFARLQERATEAFLGREAAIESGSLFATDQAVILGPLWQIGLGFYLGVVPLAVASWYGYRQYEPGWLVVAVFAWLWLAFAAVQARFAGQFAIFAAVFGAVGLLYLLGALDLVRAPDPFGGGDGLDGPALVRPGLSGKTGYLALVLVVVMLVNLVFVPTLLAQTQYSEDQVEATLAIDEHAAAHDRAYPENRVISQWGDQRMYNYVVSGESRSYNRQIYDESFVTATDPDAWAESRGNVGYVVVLDREFPAETAPAQLFDEYGLGGDSGDGLARYQLVADGESARAFAVVTGAVIEASATPNASVTAETELTVGGEQRTYARTGTADGDGIVRLRVAYPGEYTIGTTTVTVSASDVEEGAVVPVTG